MGGKPRVKLENRHTLEVVSGPAGPSLYLNRYRICGPKPWGGGRTVLKWSATDEDITTALKSFRSE